MDWLPRIGAGVGGLAVMIYSAEELANLRCSIKGFCFDPRNDPVSLVYIIGFILGMAMVGYAIRGKYMSGPRVRTIWDVPNPPDDEPPPD